MANRRVTIISAIAGAAVVAGGAVAIGLHSRPSQTVTSPMKSLPKNQPLRKAKKTASGGPTAAPLMMPVSGKVESAFGWQYSGSLNEWYYNPGISIAAKTKTPVRAAWSGTVTQVAQVPHMGLSMTVNDGDGFETVYGHLGKARFKAGQSVRQGEVIGSVGSASLYSRQPGAHLDFQIFRGKTAANPMSYLHPSS